MTKPKVQPASNINIAKQMILSGQANEVILTKNGHKVLVLMSFDEYEKLIRKISLT